MLMTLTLKTITTKTYSNDDNDQEHDDNNTGIIFRTTIKMNDNDGDNYNSVPCQIQAQPSLSTTRNWLERINSVIRVVLNPAISNEQWIGSAVRVRLLWPFLLTHLLLEPRHMKRKYLRRRIQVGIPVRLCTCMHTKTRLHACLYTYMHVHIVVSMHVRDVTAYFWRTFVCQIYAPRTVAQK